MHCKADGVVVLVLFFCRMRWCRVLARLECVCGVVVLLPQVCNTCQVTLAVMGVIVCLKCWRSCTLRCICCLMFSTCCHGFVACGVGEQALSLVTCCSVTLGTNAAVFVCYCDVCRVCAAYCVTSPRSTSSSSWAACLRTLRPSVRQCALACTLSSLVCTSHW